MIDLHTHTVHSDGTTTPTENAALAAAAGLAGIALTDHDTTDGWDEMAAACQRHGLAFVPGLELSTERGEDSVHLLGYWVDPDHTGLAAECDRLRNERTRRAQEICDRLAALGVELSWGRVTALAGAAPIGRPHIAAAMVERGVVPDITAAFDGYLADGGPAWVAKHALDPVDGVALIRDAGGAAVLAHPGGPEGAVTLDIVSELVTAGLHGIEADHPGHDVAAAGFWRAWARERGLPTTGASDFHGTNKDVHIGMRHTPRAVVDALHEATVVPAGKEGVPW